METHLNSLRKTYGHQSLISLVNQKGREKPVKDAYERYVAEVQARVISYPEDGTDIHRRIARPA